MRSLRAILKGVVAWVVTRELLKPLGLPLLHLVQYILGLHHHEVVSYAQPERSAAAARVREIVTGGQIQTMGVDEAYMLRTAVLQTAKVRGDLAELGVFRGASARVICEARKDNRALHLFDTFEGLPETTERDVGLRSGQYSSRMEEAQDYLSPYEHVYFYKGMFPETARAVADRRFSFLHLDADLYGSTKAALEFFYPRLNPGAIIVAHDYVNYEGVRAAFDEFFADKPEPVVELSGNQCLVVKVASGRG